MNLKSIILASIAAINISAVGILDLEQSSNEVISEIRKDMQEYLQEITDNPLVLLENLLQTREIISTWMTLNKDRIQSFPEEEQPRVQEIVQRLKELKDEIKNHIEEAKEKVLSIILDMERSSNQIISETRENIQKCLQEIIDDPLVLLENLLQTMKIISICITNTKAKIQSFPKEEQPRAQEIVQRLKELKDEIKNHIEEAKEKVLEELPEEMRVVLENLRDIINFISMAQDSIESLPEEEKPAVMDIVESLKQTKDAALATKTIVIKSAKLEAAAKLADLPEKARLLLEENSKKISELISTIIKGVKNLTELLPEEEKSKAEAIIQRLQERTEARGEIPQSSKTGLEQLAEEERLLAESFVEIITNREMTASQLRSFIRDEIQRREITSEHLIKIVHGMSAMKVEMQVRIESLPEEAKPGLQEVIQKLQEIRNEIQDIILQRAGASEGLPE